MAPAISIIVRTIGAGHFAEALESLFAQTRRDFEVVIVDMSGGANAQMLKRFATKLTLRVLERPRMTRPRALNAGITAASAPVIGILDDDNLYDPRQIEILLDGLESTNADYVYTGVRHATYSTSGEWLATRETAQPFAFDQLLAGNIADDLTRWGGGDDFRRVDRVSGVEPWQLRRAAVFEEHHRPEGDKGRTQRSATALEALIRERQHLRSVPVHRDDGERGWRDHPLLQQSTGFSTVGKLARR
jgi:glycosyltransferase involved in cell wall biosynthesis